MILYRTRSIHTHARFSERPQSSHTVRGYRSLSTLLKQLTKARRLPVHNHQFTTDLGLVLTLIGVAVTDVQRLEMKAFEHPADFRMVVDADHHLAFAAPHEVGHTLVVLERKIHAIPGGLPIRRVHVVKGMGTVVAFCAFKPWEIFDVGAG